MKTINLKGIAITLSVLMLLQSCKVYHSKTATIDEVIESQKRVKVKSYNGEIYRFDKLHRENDQIFGIAKTKRQERLRNYAKQFGQGEVSGKEVKFSIPDNAIKEYYKDTNIDYISLFKNKYISCAGTIFGYLDAIMNFLEFYIMT